MSGMPQPHKSQWNDKTLWNSFCPMSDSSCLNVCLLFAILRKRSLPAIPLHLWAAERAGDEEWCGCLVCQQTASSLSHAHGKMSMERCNGKKTTEDFLSWFPVSEHLNLKLGLLVCHNLICTNVQADLLTVHTDYYVFLLSRARLVAWYHWKKV